jgi:hypothetical protein
MNPLADVIIYVLQRWLNEDILLSAYVRQPNELWDRQLRAG